MKTSAIIKSAIFTHNGIIAGKLNGVIPAVTPKGTLYEAQSISFAIPGKVDPICIKVKLQALIKKSITLNNVALFWI